MSADDVSKDYGRGQDFEFTGLSLRWRDVKRTGVR